MLHRPSTRGGLCWPTAMWLAASSWPVCTFYTAEGWSASNCSLMRNLVETLQTLQHPWVIAGDFNMEPDELTAGFWYVALRPTLVAPRQPTHEQGGKWRTLSYFLVRPSLVADVLGCSIWPGYIRGGHRPVGIQLRCRKQGGQMVRLLRRVRPLPLEEPIGCRREPLAWPAVGGCTSTQAGVDDLWARLLIARVEEQVVALNGIESEEVAKMTGRRERPEWRICKAVARSAPNRIRPGGEGQAWRQLAQWAAELARLYKRMQDVVPDRRSPACRQKLQAAALRKAAEASAAEARKVQMGLRRLWRVLTLALAHRKLEWKSNWRVLDDIAAAAAASAKLENEASMSERKRSRAEALDRAAQGSAALLHRWTKPAVVWTPMCSAVGHQCGELVGGPMAEVVAALAEWSQVWRVGQPVQASAPRPWLKAVATKWPPLQEEDIERAALIFKKRAGIGVDDYHPRLLLRISPLGRQAFADLLNGIEEHRIWPERCSTLLAWLALKEGGGRRVLIMLASTIRLWEAARQPVLDAWNAANVRDWDAATQQGGAETTAWEALLLHKAVDPRACCDSSPAVTTIVLDLIKAFEPVEPWIALGWCIYWGIDPDILAVVFGYFTMERRLIVNDCHSDPVRTCTAF